MARKPAGKRPALKVTVADQSGTPKVRRSSKTEARRGPKPAKAQPPLTRPGPRDAPAADIRAWARASGFDVPDRGPLRAEVTRAWRTAKREKP